MRKPRLRVQLIFKADMVASVGYVGSKEDQLIDELLAPIAISKTTVPCG